MALLYAKAAGGNWGSASTWSATGSGGADNAGPPTTTSDVIFEAGSGAVTILGTPVCRSLNCTSGTGNYTGTLTHNGAVTLTIGDGTAGAGNVALKLSSGMTYTLVNTTSSALVFASTSATQQTITTAGKTLGDSTFGGGGSSYLLSDNLTTSGTLTHANGVLDYNSKTISIAVSWATTGSSTRTVTLGSAAITTVAWSNVSIGSQTWTANTATVTISGNGSAWTTGAKNYSGTSVVMTGSSPSVGGGGGHTVANFTKIGNAIITDDLSLVNSFTVTGTFTITSAAANQRVLVHGSVLGTQQTITAAAVSLSNVDFMDFIGAGSATWVANPGTTLGDALGNSGITFAAPATQTWQGTSGGNWSAVVNWTSRVPLPQDNVVFSSAFVSGITVTTDMTRLGADINWSGATWSGTAPRMSGGTSTTSCWYGSITFASGMGTTSLTGNIWQARGRSTHNLNFNNVAVAPGLTIFAPGGTYNLQSSYTQSNSSGIAMGTYNTNNFNVTVASTWNVSGTGLGATCNFGTSTFTFTSVNVVTFLQATPTAVINADSATFVVANTSTNTRTFAGAGNVFGTLTYIVAGSTGALILSGNNKFGTINFSDTTNTRTIQFTSGTTTTIGNFNIFGTSGKLMTLSAVTPGAAATLVSRAPWTMGANSTNVSGNTGLTFSADPERNWLSVQDITGVQATQGKFFSF